MSDRVRKKKEKVFVATVERMHKFATSEECKQISKHELSERVATLKNAWERGQKELFEKDGTEQLKLDEFVKDFEKCDEKYIKAVSLMREQIATLTEASGIKSKLELAQTAFDDRVAELTSTFQAQAGDMALRENSLIERLTELERKSKEKIRELEEEVYVLQTQGGNLDGQGTALERAEKVQKECEQKIKTI